MEYEFLRRLYMICTESDPYFREGLNLNELCADIEDTKAESLHMYELLKGLDLSFDDRDKWENQLFKLYSAYELQGFINGFRIAMRVAKESDVGSLLKEVTA